MATQNIDFSLIESVTLDGQSLSELYLDAVQVWAEAVPPPSGVSYLWLNTDIILDSSTFGRAKGVSLSGDGKVCALTISQYVSGPLDNDNSYRNRVEVFERSTPTSTDWGSRATNAIPQSPWWGDFNPSKYCELNQDGSKLTLQYDGACKYYEYNAGTQVYDYVLDIFASSTDLMLTSLSSDGTLLARADGQDVLVYENLGSSWLQLGATIDFNISPTDVNSLSLVQGSRSLPSQPSGAMLAIGNGNSRVRVYEEQSSTWAQVGSTIFLSGGNDAFVELSEDGQKLAVLGQVGSPTVSTYRLIANEWVKVTTPIENTYEWGVDSPTRMSFSRDGNTLFIASATTSKMFTWNVSSWEDTNATFQNLPPLDIHPFNSTNGRTMSDDGYTLIAPSSAYFPELLFVMEPPEVYEITANKSFVREGESVTFTLQTYNLNDGNVAYTITGIAAGDISEALTGNFAVVDSVGTQVINVVADTTTEGLETMTITLDNGEASLDMPIQDTSVDP